MDAYALYWFHPSARLQIGSAGEASIMRGRSLRIVWIALVVILVFGWAVIPAYAGPNEQPGVNKWHTLAPYAQAEWTYRHYGQGAATIALVSNPAGAVSFAVYTPVAWAQGGDPFGRGTGLPTFDWAGRVQPPRFLLSQLGGGTFHVVVRNDTSHTAQYWITIVEGGVAELSAYSSAKPPQIAASTTVTGTKSAPSANTDPKPPAGAKWLALGPGEQVEWIFQYNNSGPGSISVGANLPKSVSFAVYTDQAWARGQQPFGRGTPLMVSDLWGNSKPADDGVLNWQAGGGGGTYHIQITNTTGKSVKYWILLSEGGVGSLRMYGAPK
jgi:hypothetical protein